MTNLQLFLSIGIPSLLVVLSWMSNTARFAAYGKRIDVMGRRFKDVISAQLGDALEILRNMTALYERVAVIETKQASAA